MAIHLVRVPQDVDVANTGENQRNEENVPHFFRSMLTAMILVRAGGSVVIFYIDSLATGRHQPRSFHVIG